MTFKLCHYLTISSFEYHVNMIFCLSVQIFIFYSFLVDNISADYNFLRIIQDEIWTIYVKMEVIGANFVFINIYRIKRIAKIACNCK